MGTIVKLFSIRDNLRSLRDQTRDLRKEITLAEVRSWNPPYKEGTKPVALGEAIQQTIWSLEEMRREITALEIRIAEVKGQLKAGSLSHLNLYVVSVPTLQRRGKEILRVECDTSPEEILRAFFEGSGGRNTPSIVDGPYSDIPQYDSYLDFERAKSEANRRTIRSSKSARFAGSLYHAHQFWRITPTKCEVLYSVEPEVEPTEAEKQALNAAFERANELPLIDNDVGI
jgi:hypothetical protein